MRPKEAERFKKSRLMTTKAKTKKHSALIENDGNQSRDKFKAPVASKASLVLEGAALHCPKTAFTLTGM